jgi:ATP-dependent helicase Lhr and Lhr-like helicase
MPSLEQQSIASIHRWFKSLGKRPFNFQRETWQAYLRGDDGLVHSPTGTGKTLAVFLGPIIEWLASNKPKLRELQERQKSRSPDVERTTSQVHTIAQPRPKMSSIDRLNRVRRPRTKLKPLNENSQVQILWITPLRALATDTRSNLSQAMVQLGLGWQIEQRTGDTDLATKNRQRKQLPEVLIITPESLTAMLSWEDSLQRFQELKLIVVDEWHDLMGTKRGVQTELALARVRKLQPVARTWGLSATIGNLSQAMDHLFGDPSPRPQRLITSSTKKEIEIQSVIPENIERFPWAGHLGIRLAPEVAGLIMKYRSSLIFTNTRSQTETWYQSLLKCAPQLAGKIAVHHGSLDQNARRWVEDALRDGTLTSCVCTSSLVQRAGRSGHQPNTPSRVTFVPTNAIELIELAAVRDSIASGHIENRLPLCKPLDVLVQHVVTIALGGGFESSELLSEVRSTCTYRSLTDQEWQWVIDFAERGGASLNAYPDFKRIQIVDGRYRVPDKRIAARHRMSIGTIVGDAAMQVKLLKGGLVGTVEESFISRIEVKDKFILGGKLLQLVRIHDNTAWVRKAEGTSNVIPRWSGGRLPLSQELSTALRRKIEDAGRGLYDSAEMQAVKPLLEIQSKWSGLPAAHQLLIEQLKTREGYHLFFYPFDGRMVHEGLAALFALRMSRLAPISFSMAMNDYGFALVSPSPPPLAEALRSGLLDGSNIANDLLSSLNESEMSKRHFREIARIAGLIFDGYPSQRKRARQLQASSNLFFDAFRQYDPQNLLLEQARREVLEKQLEHQRLVSVLNRLSSNELMVRVIKRPTPLAFPLIVDRWQDRLSSEKLSDRIRRFLEESALHTEGANGESQKQNDSIGRSLLKSDRLVKERPM